MPRGRNKPILWTFVLWMEGEGMMKPIMALALPLLLASAVRAQDLPGDPVIGGNLAAAWCSDCHALTRDSGGARVAGARPFAEIARDPSTTALRLRVFLQSTHPTMPNFRLEQSQIDDILSHILDLRRR